jgi:hypothetical protein
MLFRHYYPEGAYAPEKHGNSNYWSVWCATGLLKTLNSPEVRHLIDTGQELRIIGANGAFFSIDDRFELWHRMREISQSGHNVEVFELKLTGTFVPWTGEADALREFDAVRINHSR